MNEVGIWADIVKVECVVIYYVTWTKGIVDDKVLFYLSSAMLITNVGYT